MLQATVQADNANRNMDQLAKDLAVIKQQFNQMVPENDTKWQLIHPREGTNGYDFAPADAFVNFGLSNNMYLVGHTLLWHSQTPGWVFQGTNTAASTNAAAANPGGRRGGRGGPAGPRATREQLIARMQEHISTVVGHFKGKIKVWDVVNEALADGGTNVLRDTLWTQIIGPDFIAMAFKFAHEADPDAILRYNDYGLENPAKRRKLITLVKQLQEQKIPIMAVGTQTHVNVNTTFAQIDQELTELEALGLQIHVTEMDVNGAQGGQRGGAGSIDTAAATTTGGMVSNADRRQAEAYTGLFKAFVKHKNSVKVVTFWGVNDGVSWLRNASPLLFNANDEPKPAFDAVIKVATEASK
jgi:endo-1,4-beta-xylanase